MLSSSPDSGAGTALYPNCAGLRERDERLEGLKLIVGKLAHDFNNFLVPMLGYVTLIKEELGPNSSAVAYANTMEGAARKTEGYLDTVLLAVRPNRSFHPKMVDFKRLVAESVQEWQKAIPETAHVMVQMELHDCSLYLDEQQWKNVLTEILNNARFALATGGVLEVKLATVHLNPRQCEELGVAGPRVHRLEVTDSGFGMGTSALRRAFEPFFTTRTNAPGAGLGLTVVHSVTKLHGGQVLLESLEDKGTTVTILLPDRPEPAKPAEQPAGPQKAEPNPHAGGSKILLVEDDPLVREVIKACLQKTKLEVVVGQDGEQGLRLFKRHAKDLALVVTDVTMPKMNGIDLFVAIREIDPQMRVILVSGDAEGTREEALSRLGKERPLLVKKPFTLKAFTEVIRNYLS